MAVPASDAFCRDPQLSLYLSQHGVSLSCFLERLRCRGHRRCHGPQRGTYTVRHPFRPLILSSMVAAALQPFADLSRNGERDSM
jgi:hypothetical protein